MAAQHRTGAKLTSLALPLSGGPSARLLLRLLPSTIRAEAEFSAGLLDEDDASGRFVFGVNEQEQASANLFSAEGRRRKKCIAVTSRLDSLVATISYRRAQRTP